MHLSAGTPQPAGSREKTAAANGHTSGYEPPQGEVEETLAGLWRDVLHAEQIGRHDNFFELGGHSLSAASFTSRAEPLGFDVPVELLFRHPTISGLAGILREG
jgi:hypothetical protein